MKLVKRLSDLYKYFRWLSLDVSVGAISVLFLLQNSFQVGVPMEEYIGLFAAIWAIYLLDHFVDSKGKNLFLARRIFYRKNSFLIKGLILVSSVIGFISFIFMFRPLQVAGLSLAGLCLIYVWSSRFLAKVLLKEVIVAVGFTVGVSLPILIRQGITTNSWQWMLCLFFLALANLLVFAYFENEEDRKEGFISIGTIFTPKALVRVTISTLIASVIFPAIFISLPLPYRLFLFAASGSLIVVLLSKRHFQKFEMYRVIGDGMFLLALIFSLL